LFPLRRIDDEDEFERSGREQVSMAAGSYVLNHPVGISSVAAAQYQLLPRE
jgi:hypothetical protein